MMLPSNPIPRNGMFATPKNMDPIMDLIDGIPAAGGARVAALTAVMMTMNLLSAEMPQFVVPAVEVPHGFDEGPHG